MERKKMTRPVIKEYSSNPTKNLERKVKKTPTPKKRTFQCSKCKCHFSDSSNLEYHKSIHTSEKPFHCEICQLLFSKRSNLLTHIRIHTTKKKLPV